MLYRLTVGAVSRVGAAVEAWVRASAAGGVVREAFSNGEEHWHATETTMGRVVCRNSRGAGRVTEPCIKT